MYFELTGAVCRDNISFTQKVPSNIKPYAIICHNTKQLTTVVKIGVGNTDLLLIWNYYRQPWIYVAFNNQVIMRKADDKTANE